MVTSRAQASTLEAIAAGLVLLSSVIFALQMTAVTPLSASTSSQHIENQLESSTEGLIAASVEDGSLRRALLYYNESSGRFIGSLGSDGEYRAAPPADTTLGQRLSWAFDERGIAYNINFNYRSGNSTSTQEFMNRGEPSDNAVTASTTVVITDDTPLYETDTDGDSVAEPRSVTVSDAAASSDFYMNDISPDSGLFNVVEVEVVVWRI